MDGGNRRVGRPYREGVHDPGGDHGAADAGRERHLGRLPGKGAKTVLPAKAGAKISMRLVPDQDPDDIVEKTRRYFEQKTPPTCKLRFTSLHGGHPVLVDTRHPAMQAAAEAMARVFGRRPYFTREGGSIPVVADFKRLLGLDSVLMGFGLNSDAIHSPDEHFGWTASDRASKASCIFWNGTVSGQREARSNRETKKFRAPVWSCSLKRFEQELLHCMRLMARHNLR
nr:M20/M25/M40 family metallo-hydrolase [Rhodothermus marinus]